jgi:hypothetical protein
LSHDSQRNVWSADLTPESSHCDWFVVNCNKDESKVIQRWRRFGQSEKLESDDVIETRSDFEMRYLTTGVLLELIEKRA